jgi:hypothetical protein
MRHSGRYIRRRRTDDDLANIGIRRRHAQIGKFLQPLDRRQDSRIARRAAPGLA